MDIAKSRNVQSQLVIDSLGNLLAKMNTLPDTVYLPSKEVVVSKKEKVSYPVEKELTRLQQFRLDVGRRGIVIVIITIFVVVGCMVIN